MNYTEIIKKLIGPIEPVGETNADDKRFENLKNMCELVDNLVSEIDSVSFDNKDRQQFSLKRAGQYADEFLSKTLNIQK